MSKRLFMLVFICFMALALCGCQVPNLQPFADATIELRNGVAAVGETVADAMERAELGREDDPTLARNRESFNAAWQYRVAAMNAMVEYAVALAAIAESGEYSKEAARRINQSITRLALAAGPIGAAASVVSPIAEQVADSALDVHTFRSLRTHVSAAHPHIVQIGNILSQDFRGRNGDGEELAGAPVNIHWAACEDRLLDIVDTYRTVRTHYLDVVRLRDNFGMTIFKSRSTVPCQEKLGEYAEHAALADMLRPEFLLERELRSEVQRERIVAMAMFRFTADSIDAWITAHADLHAALADNRQPDVSQLHAYAAELRRTVHALRIR